MRLYDDRREFRRLKASYKRAFGKCESIVMQRSTVESNLHKVFKATLAEMQFVFVGSVDEELIQRGRCFKNRSNIAILPS